MQNKDIYDMIIKNLTEEWYDSMTNRFYPTKWETPQYSKKQIDRAGKIIANPTSTPQEVQDALVVLNNWRSSHAYPLQVIASNLRRKNPNAIVVQRLKRLDSITGKLERFPEMSLYRMQDLGGCRVIVDNIDQVYQSLNKYKSSRIRHIFKRENDYIQNPKSSGYRSYHIVYQFHSDDKETYNKNMLIEIQFRTQLQHIWATAVEMMGIYTKSNLKSSQGNTDILRFFTLVSSLFAIRENTPVCPDTSDWADELIHEIIELNEKDNIMVTLKAINNVVQLTQSNEHFYLKNGYYLLILNYNELSINVYPFKQSDQQLASQTYSEIERTASKDTNVVLVSAKSFDILKAAYPNYFTDISKFLNVLEDTFSTYNYTLANNTLGFG